MLRITALMISTYCIAFVLTSVVAAPERLRGSMTAAERVVAGLFEAEASERTPRRADRALVRADALGTPAATTRRAADRAEDRPAFAEIGIGPSGAIVARDDGGRIVFAHDPAARTTAVARGIVPPRLSMGPASADPRLDVVPNPLPPETRPETPTQDGVVPPGCETAVGPLAVSADRSGPVLCLARL